MRAIILAAVLWLSPSAAAFVRGVPACEVGQSKYRAAVSCGPRVTIYSVGKAARDEPWIVSGIAEYTRRLRTTLDIECAFVKNDDALLAAVRKSTADGASGVLILDERGSRCTSVQFSERLFTSLEAGGSRLNFFIGGADGLPDTLKADRSRLISLSSLTFPHQVARLLLVEQIYRASEIRKGTGYHKD